MTSEPVRDAESVCPHESDEPCDCVESGRFQHKSTARRVVRPPADDVAPRRSSRFTPEELARFGGKVDKDLVRKVMRERRIRQGLICRTCGEWPEYCGCPEHNDGRDDVRKA